MLASPSPPDRASPLECGRLYGAARALAIAQLATRAPQLTLAIVPDIATRDALDEECRFFLGPQADLLLPFPDWETLPYDLSSPHGEIVSQRLRTLCRLADWQGPGLLLVAVPTLLQRLCPPAYIRAHTLMLECGTELEIETLRHRLNLAGYRACPTVLAPGEFSVRGAVVDVFPMGARQPCRLDFFDNRIDSIRLFDPERQISTGKADAVEMLPGREFPLTPEAIDRFRRSFRRAFDIDPTVSPIYRGISDTIAPVGIEYYLPLFFERTASLLDYLPAETLALCWDDIEDAAAQTLDDIDARYESRRHDIEHPPLPPEDLYLGADDFQQALAHFPRMHLRRIELEKRPEQATYNYASQALPELRIRPQNKEPARALRRFLASESRKILFTAQSPGRREQLRERLQGLGITVQPVSGWEDFCRADAPRALTVADVHEGFELPEADLALIPEPSLFPSRPPQRRRDRSRADPRAILAELSNLQIGSPVVHEDYGVGRFQGLKKLDIDGLEHEFLYIEYAGTDRLYVPIMELHRITRYSGADPENAPLHALAGDQWQATRRKAMRRAYDVAAELLEVQARRTAQSGCRLNTPDDYPTFAAAFPFDETPDQTQAIRDVLADLEADAPMDRIVCGDVGFGKTEVGMRAAFAAAFNGCQVAILTPTTLLAQQHGKTLRDRFAGWPMKIETLSRFKSRRAQADVLEELASGQLDIVIGTHRLLQDDVRFKNLGLVIVDEEQRFGVRHKEKLKSLRATTNLLTLTATPIPRTLNMSLSGLRDLSIIATAPAHRHAIKTYVVRWNDLQIRDACLRELKRGGQIYVLHNRVETIEQAAAEIRELAPGVEVRTAHGQMRERDLEAVMRDFYQQRFNILVCTTIIESGIDIPTANTIIIKQADRFGLPQLHQLRGRVGRSHHLAYAYLVCPPLGTLNADARKRIQAIESMEELGSGFMLATHDLEIRGAGELLGEEQSGQIQQVGFALYHRLLQRAVATLKQGAMPELDKPLEHGPEIDVGLPALIPEDYLPDVYLRLVLYKRIASAGGDAELDDLQVEMVDRFGTLPEATLNLFAITRLKLEIAAVGHVRKVEVNAHGGRLSFADPQAQRAAIMRLAERHTGACRLDARMRLNFEADMPEPEDRLRAVGELARQLRASAETPASHNL